MKKEYMQEGYQLMTDYITEQRIKTKNRKFLRKLDKFYKNHQDQDLTYEEEIEYLKLEKEFYNTIAIPESNEDKALVEVLNVLTQAETPKDE